MFVKKNRANRFSRIRSRLVAHFRRLQLRAVQTPVGSGFGETFSTARFWRNIRVLLEIMR